MVLAVAVHVNGFGSWFRCSIHSSIAALSSAMSWKTPRLIRCRVIGEEPLDEVEPGAGRRREVQDEAFASCQPAFHGRCFVGGVVVEDQMQIEMGGGLAINFFEEGQELVCSMAGQTFADDFAGRDVERGKQRRGAVALIIMGHGSGAAFL